jgi:hypothetical protein
MGLIKQHLDRELSKPVPDAYMVSELNKIVNRRTTSFGEWVQSGRFINRDEYLSIRPDELLHIDCTDVIQYYGDVYLQLLKSGNFYIDASFQSPDIKESERQLWARVCESLF